MEQQPGPSRSLEELLAQLEVRRVWQETNFFVFRETNVFFFKAEVTSKTGFGWEVVGSNGSHECRDACVACADIPGLQNSLQVWGR